MPNLLSFFKFPKKIVMAPKTNAMNEKSTSDSFVVNGNYDIIKYFVRGCRL